MTVKRLAVLAVLCLGLLFGSTHKAQALIITGYGSMANADLTEGFVFAYDTYFYDNPSSINAYYAYDYAYYAQYYASIGDWYDASAYGYYAYCYAYCAYQEVGTTNAYYAQYYLYLGYVYAYYAYSN